MPSKKNPPATREGLWMKLSLLSTVVCQLLLIGFAMNKRIPLVAAMGIFQNSPREVADKYYIDISPGPVMTLIAWSLVLCTKIVSVVFLHNKSARGENIFPKSFYFHWFITMTFTSMWIICFDREQHHVNVVAVGLVCYSSYNILGQTFWRFHASEADLASHGFKPFSDAGFGDVMFRYVVIWSSIFHAVWSTVAMSSTIAFPIAYEYSAHVAQAKPRGVFSTETCSTIGLLYPALVQAIYTVLDFKGYIQVNRCAYFFYTASTITTLGILASNFDTTNGISRNNFFCAALIVSAILTIAKKMCRRDSPEVTFEKDGHDGKKRA